MKQLTLRVTLQKDGQLSASYKGTTDCRNSSRLGELGLCVPRKRYRVRFRVDANGGLVVQRGDHLRLVEGLLGYCVCFLRHTDWPEGTRVSRQVLPWA